MRKLSALVLGALVWGLVPPARGAGERELAWVEVEGTLSIMQLFTNRPAGTEVTLVTSAGKSYRLEFKNENDCRLVAKHARRTPVVVSGWLIRGQVIHVVTLKNENGTVIIPDRKVLKKIAVRVLRTPGVGDFRHRREWTLDSVSLSPAEAARLRRLIDSARFFELRSSPLRLCIPDPPAGFEVSVTLDGRRHTIWVQDAAVTKGLRLLIDHVRRTA